MNNDELELSKTLLNMLLDENNNKQLLLTLKIIKKLINNIIKNINDNKYRLINLNNKKIIESIVNCNLATDYLISIGFEYTNNDTQLIMNNVNINILNGSLILINKSLNDIKLNNNNNDNSIKFINESKTNNKSDDDDDSNLDEYEKEKRKLIKERKEKMRLKKLENQKKKELLKKQIKAEQKENKEKPVCSSKSNSLSFNSGGNYTTFKSIGIDLNAKKG